MAPPDAGQSDVPSSEIEARGPIDAPQIVFVHGAGISREMWRPQLESLSENFRVVTFDLPGHGTLSHTSFEFETAVSVLADVVAAVGPPVVLVGHSLGGYVVTEYAARWPDNLTGIVCSGSSADYRGWLGVRTRLTAALYRLGARLPFVERWFLDRTATQVRSLPVSEKTAESIIDGGFFLRSWGEAGRTLVGRDFQKRLHQFDGPVLLVNGETDTLNAPNADQLAMKLPNVEAVVIDDVGHLCNLQAPSAYTDIVRGFVEQLEADPKDEDTS